MPKKSGLLRPLTLLALDDQIVLQAIANLIANHMSDRRREVEGALSLATALIPMGTQSFFSEIGDRHTTNSNAGWNGTSAWAIDGLLTLI
jgi:hypothetical protein